MGPSEKQSGSREAAAAYQGAVEAVFAVLIAGGIGYWADAHFGTSPRYLLLGLGIGFGSFVLRLWRLGRTLQGPDAGARPPKAGNEEDQDGA